MKMPASLVRALVCLMCLSQTLSAQDSKNVTLLGNFGQGEGDSKACFAAGSLVFYSLANKLVIASFSNPAAPTVLANLPLADVIESIVRTSISGTQYLVASGDGGELWLINVQNPTRPSLVSTTIVDQFAVIEGVATSGPYAYVAAGSAGFKIYSIADPSAPSLVASIDSLAYCENVIISTPYAFIAADGPGYVGRSFIFDVSDPSAPIYKSTVYGYGGYHQAVGIRSGCAYICDYNTGLQVINISDPTHPANTVAISSGFSTACIIFDGNYAYVAVGTLGLFIYDVSTPSAPAYVTKILTGGRAAWLGFGAITISGSPKGHVFVSNRDTPGMVAINVSDPLNPTISGSIQAHPAATGSAFSSVYSGGKAYIAYGTAGLRILDVTSSSQPTLLSTLPLGDESRGIVLNGTHAYIASMDSGVYVVDVADPANPLKLKNIQTSRARGIAINGNYVYVATRDSGLVVLDAINPSDPVWLTNVRGIDVENVACDSNIVGTSYYTSIQFYDVTDPSHPVAKGNTPNFRIGDEGFCISGNHAYIPDGDSLKIFDISNSMAPTLVSGVETGGYGYVAKVSGNYCYVAAEQAGVRVVDISNLNSPTEVGHYDGVPISRGVTVNDSYIYDCEATDGFTIYSNDLISAVNDRGVGRPQVAELRQNYPNPFNPSTVVEFQTPSASHVRLEVLDLLGQTVAVLLNEQKTAGIYHVTFNAEHLSTGLFFCRLTTGNTVIVRKMLLLK